MRNLTVAGLLLLGLGSGCSWSTFEELGDETWVDSAGAAEGVDPNQFLGLAAPGTTEDNAVFVALGRATDSVGRYTFEDDGERTSEGVDIRGEEDSGGTGFGPMSPGVPIAGDPYSNRVGVAAVTGAANDMDTKVATFDADNITVIASLNDFNGAGAGALDGNTQANGMVFARTDDDGLDTTDIVLARGNQIALISDYDVLGTPTGCLGAEASDVVMNVAAGQFDADANEELVVVINDQEGTLPQIVIFEAHVIPNAFADHGMTVAICFDDADTARRAPIARISGPAGEPDFGKQLVVGDFDGDDDIVVSSPASNLVTAYISDGDLADGGETLVVVDATGDSSLFGASLAVGDLGGGDDLVGDGIDDLVVGAPRSNIDGASNAGAVHVYSYEDGASSFTLEVTVNDASPEAEQQIGTAVAVAPWVAGDRNVLVVAGAKEIFTYFRTTFYGDVRTGQ